MSSNLLTSRFQSVFEDVLTPFQQDQAVDSLKDYIVELQHGTEEQHRDLDVISYDDVAGSLVDRKLHAVLERCYWQLVMFLRSSRPSRIVEAEPYLRALHKSHTDANDHNQLFEINASLHLAGALSSSEADDYSERNTEASTSRMAEALSLFTHAFSMYDAPVSAHSDNFQSTSSHSMLGDGFTSPAPQCPRRKCLPPKTELWARASYVHLLRRLEYTDEAAAQLSLIRDYVQSHPYALPLDKYRTFMCDLSAEFGLDLHVTEEEPISLVIKTDSLPIISYDSDVDSPSSPTLSLPSSSSTWSNSSTSSSPVTPSISLPPDHSTFIQEGLKREQDASSVIHLGVPHSIQYHS
ncbi:hypothetical protein BDW22DRAFT_1348358 [Trametopsis cervina]|nr:hypothetical protein BDW22DRAFT_1348358 [Trametopsis cervina]